MNGGGKQRRVEGFEALPYVAEIGSLGGKDEVTWHVVPRMALTCCTSLSNDFSFSVQLNVLNRRIFKFLTLLD